MSCPFCDISRVCSIIYDCAQINEQQLSLHRMLVGGDDDDNACDTSSSSSSAQELQRKQKQEAAARLQQQQKEAELTQLGVWQDVARTATVLLQFVVELDQKSAEDDGEKKKQKCSGAYDTQCPHVDVTAATFAAAKFHGTPGIAFVALDQVAVACLHFENTKKENSEEQQQQQRVADDIPKQQTEEEAVVGVTNEAATNSNSDRNDNSANHPRAIMSLMDDHDDAHFLVSKNVSSHHQHDEFVAAVVKAEARMMKQCGYFSKLSF